jgi:hypothetical protein
VEAAGGQVVSIPVVEGFSTSSIIHAALKSGSQESEVKSQEAASNH